MTPLPSRLPRPLIAAWLAAAGLLAYLPAARAVDAGAQPLLHAVFQDHAVLQRDRPIRVWGRAKPGDEVRVTLAGKRARGHADADGRWQARLPALPAGGPHTLSASAGDATQSLGDVLVGDVWLCSGQSNMELPVWRALDARAEIAGAGNDRIRLLTVPQAGSVVPQERFAGPTRWTTTTPETLRDFSAACYYFARELQKAVDVPMGLVNAAWGGSRIQAWTSGEALRTTGLYDDELEVLARYADDPVAATARWGEVWATWWRGRADVPAGDEPWDPRRPAGVAWREAPLQLGAWERWGVPELSAYDGMVWYRTTVALTQAQAAQDAVLALGAADEIDTTWVNGRAVGSTYGPGSGREYALPRGLLRDGGNVVVVNVLDTYRDGGLAGPASAHALRLADGSSVPLDGGWQYRVASGRDLPPPAPWQSAAGLSTLYNGMIAPLAGYGLRGVAWYQGESNTFEADRYRTLLGALRRDWRARFGDDRLPLLVVQLAGHGMPATRPGESGWAALREAQRLAAGEDPRTRLVVAIDIGDRYDIHPPNKQEVGRRLARAARHVAYGERLPPSGPVPLSARREGDAVVVAFGDASGGLVAYGADGPIGFELCSAAPGSCHYALATIGDGEIALRAPVPDVARVRYCWADGPVCTLHDAAGLPAGPFEVSIP